MSGFGSVLRLGRQKAITPGRTQSVAAAKSQTPSQREPIMNKQTAINAAAATQELSDAQLEAISGGCRRYENDSCCEKKYDSCENSYKSYCDEDSNDYNCESSYDDCSYERRPRHHRRHQSWS
jgi:hypothetical protein